MDTWPLQDAKARLSELVKEAVSHGPQTITLRGEPAVVVIAQRDYQRLRRGSGSFVDFIRRSPLRGAALDVTRDRSLPRDVDL
jgi:prevent-host-death family protein